VWLTCAGLAGTGAVTLNGHCLAQEQTGPFAFEVTQRLRQRNQLEIVVAGAAPEDGPWGEIALEVRCAAYLEGLTARRCDDGGAAVSGRLAGSWPDPLELYGLADGKPVYYQSLTTAPGGVPFAFVVPAAPHPPRRLRVDLVNVAAIWHTWETDLADDTRPA
ncbi:MAG: hypothetical protein NZO58_06510, partial [Gemmataceae bacterium]|nr:hypothetical protein [Gemmataceae bacterium]